MMHGLRRASTTAAVATAALLTLAGQAGATSLSFVSGQSYSGCSLASGTYNYYDTHKQTPSGKKLYTTDFDIEVKDQCHGDPSHDGARLYLAYWQYKNGLEEWVPWYGVKTNGTYNPGAKAPKNVWNLIMRVCDWNPKDGTRENTCARVL